MNLLIIGGTKFLGPHLIEHAVERGHAVTAFTRGTSGAPRAGVTHVVGNRDGDLERLEGRWYDAIIDTCGHVPRVVRAGLRLLGPACAHYTYISTISVYAEPLGGTFAEGEPVVVLADNSVESITPETYGGLKALCEREVRAALPDSALIVRPGLIVGPLDSTDRFTYWPNRFALGGDVLVPGSAHTFVSFIDVRDLARWIITSVEKRLTGTFNASGAYGTVTMGEVIDACARLAGAGAPIWVDEQFLIAQGVVPWTEMPLWVPAGEDYSLTRVRSDKANAAGLRYRPLEETVAATLAWTKAQGLERPLRAGITREREAALLTLWRARAAR